MLISLLKFWSKILRHGLQWWIANTNSGPPKKGVQTKIGWLWIGEKGGWNFRKKFCGSRKLMNTYEIRFCSWIRLFFIFLFSFSFWLFSLFCILCSAFCAKKVAKCLKRRGRKIWKEIQKYIADRSVVELVQCDWYGTIKDSFTIAYDSMARNLNLRQNFTHVTHKSTRTRYPRCPALTGR